MALSACGGGSSVSLTPEQRAVESNKKITGMLTYMETDANGKTINSRTASMHRDGSVRAGTTGGKFDLSDVKFAMADEGFSADGFTFHVNSDKQIDGIDMYMAKFDDYPADGPKYFKRVGDSNKFTGIIKANGWEDAQLTYESLGKELGLKYADFGNFKVDKKNPETGKFLALDAGATLKFDKENATSTLSADFANWYKVDFVTSVKDEDGNDATSITFSKYESTDETFRMINDPKREDASAADSFTLYNTTYEDREDDIVSTENSLNYDVRYFGDSGNPSEAVTLIQIRDCNGAGCGSDYDEHQEVRMNLSFGGKAQ